MNEALIAQAQLGDKVRAFLEGDIGQYLLGCAKQDIEAAKDLLFDLDPHKFTTLIDLQNEIIRLQDKGKKAMGLQGYLSEAIVNGDQAIHQLESAGE